MRFSMFSRQVRPTAIRRYPHNYSATPLRRVGWLTPVGGLSNRGFSDRTTASLGTHTSEMYAVFDIYQTGQPTAICRYIQNNSATPLRRVATLAPVGGLRNRRFPGISAASFGTHTSEMYAVFDVYQTGQAHSSPSVYSK